MKDYREPEGLIDRTLIDRLLDHEGDLSEGERDAFWDMSRQMSQRGQSLRPKQRDWAEAVYRKADIQRHYAANLATKGGGKGKKPKAHPLDSVQASRPLAPPLGRRVSL